MRLTLQQLEHLVREMRATAGGIEVVLETLTEAGTDSIRYPDHSMTVQLAILLDVAAPVTEQ